jgi:hypothetical protein
MRKFRRFPQFQVDYGALFHWAPCGFMEEWPTNRQPTARILTVWPIIHSEPPVSTCVLLDLWLAGAGRFARLTSGTVARESIQIS